MKTTKKALKSFDTVGAFRKIKEEISKEIKDMNFEQLKAYLDKTKLKPGPITSNTHPNTST
jgi:hypothetical protein